MTDNLTAMVSPIGKLTAALIFSIDASFELYWPYDVSRSKKVSPKTGFLVVKLIAPPVVFLPNKVP